MRKVALDAFNLFDVNLDEFLRRLQDKELADNDEADLVNHHRG